MPQRSRDHIPPAPAPHSDALGAMASGSRRILAAAIEAFARRGYDSASVRRIAGDANVDPALINHQFGSKEKLWRTCVDEVASRVLDRLDAKKAAAAASLAGAVDILADLICDEPIVSKFILAEISRQDERFDYVHAKLISPILNLLRSSPGARSQAGELADEFRLFAIAGALATTATSQPFMTRDSRNAITPDQFRKELKRAVAALLPEPQRAAPRARCNQTGSV